eukprot:GHVR01042394.1.p1 GENE.GHVR01042394.1~~GHVR01042394.1.p1  ORF type:complete len:169 (-),score=10.66 GHVR01042394.1:151-657(-)
MFSTLSFLLCFCLSEGVSSVLKDLGLDISKGLKLYSTDSLQYNYLIGFGQTCVIDNFYSGITIRSTEKLQSKLKNKYLYTPHIHTTHTSHTHYYAYVCVCVYAVAEPNQVTEIILEYMDYRMILLTQLVTGVVEALLKGAYMWPHTWHANQCSTIQVFNRLPNILIAR